MPKLRAHSPFGSRAFSSVAAAAQTGWSPILPSPTSAGQFRATAVRHWQFQPIASLMNLDVIERAGPLVVRAT